MLPVLTHGEEQILKLIANRLTNGEMRTWIITIVFSTYSLANAAELLQVAVPDVHSRSH